jgi:hypothetical protein
MEALFGQSEIQDLGVSAARDEDVGRLDVSMNDSLSVSRIQGITRLDSDLEYFLKGERFILNSLFKGSTLEKLHHHEGVVGFFTDIIDSADIGVIQGRGGTCFTLETFQGKPILGKLSG